MLTADQLSAICAKYGACNIEALQEAARMAAEQCAKICEQPCFVDFDDKLLMPIVGHRNGKQCAAVIRRRVNGEPDTPPSHPRSVP
jgi:hypothetical protein